MDGLFYHGRGSSLLRGERQGWQVKISNVPPGKYTVEAMHRKANGGKPVSKEIEVKADGGKLDFTLEVPVANSFDLAQGRCGRLSRSGFFFVTQLVSFLKHATHVR